MTQPLLLWLRQDLRLSDHPALLAAIEAKCPIIPVFILDTTAGVRPWGGASLWWLHHSLKQLAADFAARGATLILREGGIIAGRPLRSTMLRELMAIQQGQSVKLVSRGPGFQVAAEGRALNSAAEGQVAQARVASGRTLSGIARSGGTIELSP